MGRPEKIEAAVLVELNKPLEIATLTLPETLEAGQVLVKLHYSGICGSQIGEIDGAKGPDRFLPHLLGHEGTASVLEIGPGVRHVSLGDLVVMHWRKSIGIECVPPKYDWDGKVVNAGWVTTFNNYAIVSENRLTPISKDSDKRVGALFGCAVTTGFGVVENNANIKIGESVVVFGAGGVGLNVIQASSLRSADPIIAVDLFENRLDLAMEMGATHRINASKENAEEKIKEILADRQLDVFIDNTGNPEIIAMGYEMTHGLGRTVLVGVPKAGNKTTINTLPLHFGKLLTGSHGGEAEPAIDIPKFNQLYDKGRIQLKELITQEYPLSEINKAIKGMRDGSISGRVLINFSD